MDSLMFCILVIALTLIYKRATRKKQKNIDMIAYNLKENNKRWWD